MCYILVFGSNWVRSNENSMHSVPLLLGSIIVWGFCLELTLFQWCFQMPFASVTCVPCTLYIWWHCFPASLSSEQALISRQSYAGLLWSKQFYHYIIKDWLEGDPETPHPPESRLSGRNAKPEWRQLFNRDVISMPDKWEYPWVS